jgi:hypothetical protein
MGMTAVLATEEEVSTGITGGFWGEGWSMAGFMDRVLLLLLFVDRSRARSFGLGPD